MSVYTEFGRLGPTVHPFLLFLTTIREGIGYSTSSKQSTKFGSGIVLSRTSLQAGYFEDSSAIQKTLSVLVYNV